LEQAMNGNGTGIADLELSDEALMRQLAAGQAEALAPLHGRYAARIFGMSAQSLDREAAEEIVQEVFVVLWRKAESYDPARGPFRAWLFRIAHNRILNELRRQRRRLRLAAYPAGEVLALFPDPGPEPADVAWSADRRTAVLRAVATLPLPQRQALSLAFFENLSHEQVAGSLNVPVGTAKTRIRAGIQKLRVLLAPLMVMFLASNAILGVIAVRVQIAHRRFERALDMVTRSDVIPLRLAAADGFPTATHGQYRSRPNAPVAVLTLSNLPPLPAGRIYLAWALHRGQWIPLGKAAPDHEGRALLIAESPQLAGVPEAIQVTLERSPGAVAPRGRVVLVWPGR
jgi:RNA polymerase sigma factor (sigma-70 family)